jgi:uncharacterized protein
MSTIDELLERGRALFDGGHYFEAHEVWEEAWHRERGESRTALQGLIQVAAGLHKANLGQPQGCVRLLEAGLSKLTGPGSGPQLHGFAVALEKTLDQARRWERGEVSGPGPVPALGHWKGGDFVGRS